MLFDLLDLVAIVFGGQIEGDLVVAECWLALCGVWLRQWQHRWAAEETCVVVEDDGFAVDAEAGQRQVVLGGVVGDALEGVAALVGEEASEVEVLGEGLLDLMEEGGDFFGRVRGEDAEGMEEEIAAVIVGVEARGFEEDGVGGIGRQGGDRGREWSGLGHGSVSASANLRA